MAFQSGSRDCGPAYFGQTDSTWNLNTGAIGLRTWTKDITFATRFSESPAVVVMLKGFEFMHGDPPRIIVGATAISATGFTLNITTWGGTQVAGVSVQWMAYDSESAL